MIIKTSELEGASLDWAVAFIENGEVVSEACKDVKSGFSPSTNWAQGGPLIEEHGITIEYAMKGAGDWFAYQRNDEENVGFYDARPLIAAMRAIVTAKLGDETDIPDELVS